MRDSVAPPHHVQFLLFLHRICKLARDAKEALDLLRLHQNINDFDVDERRRRLEENGAAVEFRRQIDAALEKLWLLIGSIESYRKLGRTAKAFGDGLPRGREEGGGNRDKDKDGDSE